MEQSSLHRRGLGLRRVDCDCVSDGYTLVTHLTSRGIVRLIDNDGREVHRWQMPARPGRHARISKNGNLAYNEVHPDSPRLFPLWQKYRGGLMVQVDPDGNVVQKWEDPLAHHDQSHLDEGTILYTTLEALTPEQALAVKGGIPGTEADGDHINLNDLPLGPHYTRDHYPLINSVSLTQDGNILASLRSVSAVIIISRSTGEIICTGEIIWHLDQTLVAQQHHATELDDGSILIFDNGVYRHNESFPFSRVIQVDRKTKAIIWQYKDPNPMTFFSPFMGSAQRLQKGITLITEAAFGRIFEVTREGKTCWEYVAEDFANYKELDAHELDGIFDYPANAIFRAYKYLPHEIPWLADALDRSKKTTKEMF